MPEGLNASQTDAIYYLALLLGDVWFLLSSEQR